MQSGEAEEWQPFTQFFLETVICFTKVSNGVTLSGTIKNKRAKERGRKRGQTGSEKEAVKACIPTNHWSKDSPRAEKHHLLFLRLI